MTEKGSAELLAEKMNFEETMAELEKTVKLLEGGEVSLDESIKLFEKGIKLSKACQKMLDAAEKKVTVLMADGKEDSNE